jgi:hypothetical protein
MGFHPRLTASGEAARSADPFRPESRHEDLFRHA